MILGLKSPIKCMVRKEYFSNESGYVDALIIAITCEQSRQPTFTVLLDTGAKYDPIPINAICHKKCKPMPISDCSWWDSLSDEFNIEVIPTIKDMFCQVRSRNGATYKGNYLLTLKFKGGWAEVPQEHKVFDLIKLFNGNFFWTVNNKTTYLDSSFCTSETIKLNRNTQIYSSENYGHTTNS